MANTEVLKEFIAEYKDQLDVKAFRYALRIAKIKQKLSNTEDAEVEQQVEVLLEQF